MDTDYAQLYPRLFAQHWWWRSRETVILAELERLKPDAQWGTILDVGCGEGLFFETLSQFGEVEGVERGGPFPGDRNDPRWRIHRVAFEDQFDPGRRYDLILMLDVLEHIDDPVQSIRKAEELLERDGILFITVPAYRLLWTYHDDLNHHRTRFTRRSLRAVMEHSGLEIRQMRYFFHWIFPVRILIRLYETLSRRNLGPPRIPAAWINNVLIHGSRLEYRLLRGLGIPFGSSLMMVAAHGSPSSIKRGTA